MDRYSRGGGTEEEARATLARHRYRPLDGWPGLFNRPWRVFCLKCGAQVTVRVSELRASRVRQRCHHPAENVLVPAYSERQRMAAELQSRSAEPAGPQTPTPKRKGRRNTRLGEAEARVELFRQDYEPVDAYPGDGSSEWHARCLRCEAELWVRPTMLRQLPVRRSCRHSTIKIIVPSRAHREARQRATENQ